MNILDLGCHDGFVGRWVMDQMPEAKLYGVELNAMASNSALKRGYVNVAMDSAERADQIAANADWPAMDAVVLFELLEHAPDMDELLTAAENTLRPGGRVYVSTPDGCFGTGSNPHHLRAMRAMDVADLVRRRGTINNLISGPDGVTVCSYTPGTPKPLTCSIYLGPGWEQWQPSDIEERGLGGSETAAIRVAEELSQQGYAVTVYAQVQPGCTADVLYKPHDTFDPLEPVDLLIVQRSAQPFNRPHRAKRAMLWVHDVDFGELTDDQLTRIDDILCLSWWHQNNLITKYGKQIEPLLTRIRNGIKHELFEGPPTERQQQVVYSSSPDRGLDVLIERIWPQVREQVPTAKLVACYAEVYDKVADQSPPIAAHRARLNELVDQSEGVERIGSLSQPELARLMRGSVAWVHPSWASLANQPFDETSCIGAMEAQAAGCRVVASGWGALTETVREGVLIEAEPMSPEWEQGMVDALVEALTDEQVQQHAQTFAPAAVADLTWASVAEAIANLAGER